MSNLIEKRSPQERLIIAKTLLDGVIKDFPSAQPEIIRCKDCQYAEHKYYTDGDYYCTRTSSYPWPADGFCSDGIREETEVENED